jgi:DNA-binding transcriptional LysR family regulator
MPVNLPTNLLRSFVAIVDTGSMLNAADKVFVTQSALSLQIKRLEELLQLPLFNRDGRRLTLTSGGDLMLGYARRVLHLHDEAVNAVTVGHFSGPARIGMVQDFAETLLSGLLAQFSQLHPDAQIYSRIAGTAELLDQLERGQLDIVLGFAGGMMLWPSTARRWAGMAGAIWPMRPSFAWPCWRRPAGFVRPPYARWRMPGGPIASRWKRPTSPHCAPRWMRASA